ncbi:MAG: SUMF1/EgtB/PvdO family nonheme iron enzyme [Candidatus Eisenbacteria bacterium]|nr:SUMF1/EgtB/PvdO family nonheme iron enzyme [Candidatus Eisenbacteria bacterium]
MRISRGGLDAARRSLPGLRLPAVLAVLVAVLLFPGCAEGPTEPEDGDDQDIVISEETYIVDDDEDLTFVEADSSSVVLTYVGSPPDIGPGDVLVGGDSGGYLRSVVSVTIDGGTVTVETAEARLSDVIEEGTLEYQAVLDPWGAMRERGTLDEFKSTALPGVSISERGWEFSDVELFDDEIGGVDLEVILNGTLQFTPEFDLGAEYGLFSGITEFHTIAEGNITLLLEASASMSGALAFGDTVDLFQPIVVGAYPIPGLPLYMDVVMGMKAGFTVTANAGLSAEAGVEGNAGLRVGARWEQGLGWQNVWEPSASLNSSAQWGIEAGATAIVFVRPYVATRLCSAAGPYIGADPFLRYTIDLTPDPPYDWCWYLDGGVGAGLGFNVTIYGWELFDYYETLAEYSVSIGSDCDQLPEETGTIIIDPDPDSLNAPWVLTGPQGASGNGDETLDEMPVGLYTITWGNVSGYVTPESEQQTLDPDETITFESDYEEVEETGTIVIDPDPNSLNAPWTLTGPQHESGSGDTTLVDMPVGPYTIAWGAVSGWDAPSGDAQNLAVGATITFSGTYAPDGDDPEPPEMVTVPSGEFEMGDGVAYCGVDEREVTLTRSFYLGQHEVTNQEYMEAVQWAYDHGYVTATTSSVRDSMDGSTQELLDLDDGDCEIAFSGGVFSLRNAGHGINADHPVIEVTWYGAARYCDWLSMQESLPRAYEHSGDWSCNGGNPYGAAGYRLPTDAEWEYAAQYDDERIYPWGNEAPDCSRANFYNGYYCVGWTSPVGSYPDAPASLGLSDMAGNVWEWCNDWHVCSLGTATVSDPVGPTSGSGRVLRGGSWYFCGFVLNLRCANRDNISPGFSINNSGFRVARTVNP